MQKCKYKSTGCIGLFDKDATSAKLSKSGNPLENISLPLPQFFENFPRCFNGLRLFGKSKYLKRNF
jgi:hypothetical protein